VVRYSFTVQLLPLLHLAGLSRRSVSHILKHTWERRRPHRHAGLAGRRRLGIAYRLRLRGPRPIIAAPSALACAAAALSHETVLLKAG